MYQHLYTDITDLFFEYIHSLLPDYIQEIDDDIRSNGWVVNNILDIENSLDLLGIFQTFYHNTGRLPLTNGLLIVPDSEAPEGGDKINMKNLFEMFQQTNSYGLVSVQFLGAIHLYFNVGELYQIKDTLTKLHKNLSYTTLSGERTFEFDSISKLIGRVSFLIKGIQLMNQRKMEQEDQQNAQKINASVSFVPKIEDPLDDVIETLYHNIEHKKATHPYVPPQVQPAHTIEAETQAVDDEFKRLKQEKETNRSN